MEIAILEKPIGIIDNIRMPIITPIFPDKERRNVKENSVPANIDPSIDFRRIILIIPLSCAFPRIKRIGTYAKPTLTKSNGFGKNVSIKLKIAAIIEKKTIYRLSEKLRIVFCGFSFSNFSKD